MPNNEIAVLPVSTHIRILRSYIERERKMRGFYLKGDKRIKGLEESDQALDSLSEIEARMASSGVV